MGIRCLGRWQRTSLLRRQALERAAEVEREGEAGGEEEESILRVDGGLGGQRGRAGAPGQAVRPDKEDRLAHLAAAH